VIRNVNFGTAGPIFKNRSLAALRREADGSISLDQGLAPSEPQSVRVRIYSSGEQTGCSIIPSAIMDDAPVEARIRQARNVIFEAELWHELNRESRTLQALGVRCKDDWIICPISPSKSIILDLIHLDSSTPEPPGSDDKLAEGISLALHLLQSYAHRQNFVRRTKPPGPLTSFKRANPPYTLLRSLITRANHQSTLCRVHALSDGICSILTTISHSPSPNYTVTELPPELRPNMTPTETSVVALFEHLHAQLTLSLGESCTLIMKLRTSFYPLGTTNFNITLEPTDCVLQETCRPPGIVDHWHKANDYILFVTSCALASSFTYPAPKSEESNAEENSTSAPRWEHTTRPHVIRLVHPNQGMRQQLRSKQASFSLEYISSLEGKSVQHCLKLRVNWECMGDLSEQPSTALGHLNPEDTQDGKAAKGEGYYEWIKPEGENKVNGHGASTTQGSWGPDAPIKSLKEVMELAASI
jgi:mediator of RNA polymerase II transcription subunit 17